MSASVDVHEREDEEWKQEVRASRYSSSCLIRFSTAVAVLMQCLLQVAQQLSAVMQALQMVHSSVHALQVCPLLHSSHSRNVYQPA